VDDHVRGGTEVTDGLRGLAILMVITYHLWFILVVHAAAGHRHVRADRIFRRRALLLVAGAAGLGLRQFAYRRFLKIAPSNWLALSATVAIAFPYFAHKSNVLAPLALHLAFTNNWHADLLGWLDGAFWSLAVEIQFYLLFPLLALAFVRFPPTAVITCGGIALCYRYALDSRVMEPPVVHQVPAYLERYQWPGRLIGAT
jgi:peptidoglycan/LPS O-acetylase OafA/YrhL